MRQPIVKGFKNMKTWVKSPNAVGRTKTYKVKGTKPSTAAAQTTQTSPAAKPKKVKPTKVEKLQQQQAQYEQQVKTYGARTEANVARANAAKTAREAALQGNNPIKKWWARKQIKKAKAAEVQLRKMESEAQLAEQTPEFAAEKLKTEGRVKIAKAQGSAKMAGYTAIGTGAAQLGKGLAAENNQDDEAARKHDLQVIDTIFTNNDSKDDNNGLDSGVE